MLSFSDLILEYLNKSRSEMSEDEKKRIKYASIKKREQLKKASKEFQIEYMFDLNDPRVERRYRELLKKQQRSKNGGRKK